MVVLWSVDEPVVALEGFQTPVAASQTPPHPRDVVVRRIAAGGPSRRSLRNFLGRLTEALMRPLLS